MKNYILAVATLVVVAISLLGAPPTAHALANPSLYDSNNVLLREGDLISANIFGDPDIFIIHFTPNGSLVGYKRLFLNPAIFAFYGHLGGFANVHPVSTSTRDLFETSGLFRNCETNDQKVWATEITGEDAGVFHHVQMTGAQAISENTRFFDAVFCINAREENYYAKSITPYYHLNEVPPYFRRACQTRPACLDANPRCMMPEPMEGWCPSPSPTPPIACAMQGEYAVNYTVSPGYQVRQCCPGLVQIDYPATGAMGAASKMCAPAGCYYQQVQCIQAPCNPVLVCPTATPTPTITPVPTYGPVTIQSVTVQPIATTNSSTLYAATITGYAPTPCYSVSSQATLSGSRFDITVTATDTLAPGSACIQVIKGFELSQSLSTSGTGSFSVYANGRYWTSFTK